MNISSFDRILLGKSADTLRVEQFLKKRGKTKQRRFKQPSLLFCTNIPTIFKNLQQ